LAEVVVLKFPFDARLERAAAIGLAAGDEPDGAELSRSLPMGCRPL
jgi:hypothetical protein